MGHVMKRRVVHLTTVHPFHDNRIWEKMVRSCAEAGLETHYIAQSPSRPTRYPAGVIVHQLPAGRSWRLRILRQFVALSLLLRIGRSLVHFHDPELQPLAWVLCALGYRTVYDVHEDNALAIMQKEYLPTRVRGVIARIMAAIEGMSARCMPLVIAEKCYSGRFPSATVALNYPTACSGLPKNSPPSGEIRFLYTGVVSIDRGALNMVSLLHYMPDCTLTIVGSCSGSLRNEIISRSGSASSRLTIEAPDGGVPFATILSYYARGGWSAGLALFPSTPHYRDKELTKLFEYMQHGLPVICSDFPRWRELVVGNGAGMTIGSIDESSAVKIRSALASGAAPKWSDNGRIAACQYTWPGQFANVLELYRRIFVDGTDRRSSPILSMGGARHG